MVRVQLRAMAQRALSLRRSGAMQVAGRSGDACCCRIRPAVGDQSGGLTEARTRNTAPENDDDWIKISQYVSKLNPSILKDANTALQQGKWHGEGVQQAAFESPLVSHMSEVTIACTSEKMGHEVGALLSTLHSNGGPSGDGVFQVPGLHLRVKLMGAEWVRLLRSWRRHPERARFEGLTFVSASASLDELQQGCKERSLTTSEHENAGACIIHPNNQRQGGILQQAAMAIRRNIDILPPKFLVRLPDPTATTDAAPWEPSATAAPNGPQLQVRAKEVVVGARWEEHGAMERFLDRVAGSSGRISPGLWRLPAGPLLRLVPGDDSGLKTLVLHVSDAARAEEVLQAAGLSVQTFPGYLAIQVGGLDLRMTESAAADSFYSEVRWEVEEEGNLKSNGEGVSCVGAITHGVVQSAASGVMAKKGISFHDNPWKV